jgi:hypothetical protein
VGVTIFFLKLITSADLQCSYQLLKVIFCRYRRPREANMLHVLAMASSRGRKSLYNVSSFDRYDFFGTELFQVKETAINAKFKVL